MTRFTSLAAAGKWHPPPLVLIPNAASGFAAAFGDRRSHMAAACDGVLAWTGLVAAKSRDMHALREASIERLADTIAEYLDTAKLLRILEQSPSP